MSKTKPLDDKKKKLIIIFTAAAVVLLAAVITVILVTGGKRTGSPAPTSGETGEPSLVPDTVSPVTEPEDTSAEPLTFPEPTYPHGSAFSYAAVNSSEKPQYINPLTGLASSSDLTDTRPVAVMINNISYAMPQLGISGADVIYECLAEGGITRLLMVTRDYASLDVVGSIRSAREYYIDFAQNHNAIYVHAGGSETAYSRIYSGYIEHLDGVNGDARTGINLSKTSFYRDPERLKTMAYEHTLVTTGQLMAEGIGKMGYSTTVKEGFEEPVKPIDWGWSVVLSGDSATHIKVPYRNTHVAEYEYDKTTGKYMRYQFEHQEHIDGATGEQLGFENVMILNLAHRNTGDSYGHLSVTTVGSGNGWYITGGKRIPIKWSKDTADSAMTLTDEEGYPVVVNRGKTIINIVDGGVWSSLSFN